LPEGAYEVAAHHAESGAKPGAKGGRLMPSTTPIPVLDKGYVRLVAMTAAVTPDGSLQAAGDLLGVNAARASFAKHTDELRPADEKLIGFLGREGHTVPFRHAVVTLELKAPIVVARQLWKYRIGSAHNEIDTFESWSEQSRRYVTSEPEFYIPSEWRRAPENKKQGSGESFDSMQSTLFTRWMESHTEDSIEAYNDCLKYGVCAEQARLFLPAYALYTSWYWTASLQSWCHVITERCAADAQAETRAYGEAIRQITTDLYPLSAQALTQALTEDEG
jgi:thymidylate synthase (FAD)